MSAIAAMALGAGKALAATKAASAIGGMIGAGANVLAARAANNRSWRQTKQLFAMQQADRNAQNVYNSPANMVAMLKSAGLSPASFYGGAAQSAGSAGVADAAAPEVSSPDVSSAFSNSLGALVNNRQLDINERLANSQINLNSANAIKAMFSGRLDAWDLSQRERLQDALDEKIRNDVNLGAENIRKVKSEVARLAFDLNFDREVRDFNVEYERQKTEKEKWTAFAQKWNGMVSQFQRAYMDKHGRQVPSDMISGLIEYFEGKYSLDPPIVGFFKGLKEYFKRKDKDNRIIDEDGKIINMDWNDIKEMFPE